MSCSLLSTFYSVGGSLVKIAYLSEIEYKRPRHYSQSSTGYSSDDDVCNINYGIYNQYSFSLAQAETVWNTDLSPTFSIATNKYINI